MPLVYRVAGVNALVLLAAVAVTLVVLAPRKLSSFAVDEAAVLAGALVLVALVNLLVLRRIVRPLETLTALARRVDLTRPGARMPGATASSEAGELALTFNEMLARLETERREATGRVLEAQESERLRIALELHDQVGQELTAVLLGLARVRGMLDESLRGDVEDIQEAVRASLEDVRRIALELRPEALDDLGLVSALAVLCERFSQRTGIQVSQQLDEHLPELGHEEELVVYRVAQEALTNIARHSGAKGAWVLLEARGGEIRLEVEDDGRGIAAGDLQKARSLGLKGMRERFAYLGGALEITAAPRGGTRMRIRVPMQGKEAESAA